MAQITQFLILRFYYYYCVYIVVIIARILEETLEKSWVISDGYYDGFF